LVEVSYAELVQSPLRYVDHEGRIGPLDLASGRSFSKRRSARSRKATDREIALYGSD